MLNGSHISAGRAAKFALLPGIFPRLSDLFFSGFGPLPYLLALLCARARLLPKGHRFFHTNEKYGIRHVLAEAARHLDFRWKNVDQIIIYVAMLSGSAILLAFIAVVFSFLVISGAEAAAWVPGIFSTAQPTHDVAFMMLDRVFGIPGIFNSAIITDPATYGPAPNAFQVALHTLFGFFSWGLFIIAVVIFLYYVVQIVWDITQTGKAFDGISDGDESSGKNFAWIPLRFVLALGLLVPISNGLNSAQFVTLYVAKFGSSMATNAWGYFNMETGANPLGLDNEELIANLKPQDYTSVLKQLLIMKSCYMINTFDALGQAGRGVTPAADGSQGPYSIIPYVINGTQNQNLYTLIGSPTHYDSTAPDIVASTSTDPFVKILAFTGGQSIRIVLGYVDPSDPTKYSKYPGGVLPVCGEVNIPVTNMNPEGLFAADAYLYAFLYTIYDMPRGAGSLTVTERNSLLAVLREYTRTSTGYRAFVQSTFGRACLYDYNNDGYESIDEATNLGTELGKCTEAVPSKYWNDYLTISKYVFSSVPIWAARSYLVDDSMSMCTSVSYCIGDTAFSSLGMPDPLMLRQSVVELGWGGAGLWFNTISEKNGSLVTAIDAAPSVTKMPMVMEQIKAERSQSDPGIGKGFCSAYAPQRSGTNSSNIADEKTQFNAEETKLLYKLCTTLFENEQIVVGQSPGGQIKPKNPVEHAMASVFGQWKLFDIRDNEVSGSVSVQPMAQMSAVGRMLIDKSILSMMAAVGSSVAGGALHVQAGSADGEDIAGLNLLGESFGEAAGAALTFATVGLTVGVVLHYVLPLLPFIYFFFAVARWVKTIFEAMVGVPLWALAHLRTSGQGLPGDAASSGYFLLLEIFVRPIITVISLIGAYSIFTALAIGLNSIFLLVVSNFAGADMNSADPDVISSIRGIIDEFFYSIFYILLVYMIATSCFKLIDLVPDNILSRWSGAGVSSIGASDNADDLVDQLQYQMPLAVQYFAKEMGEVVTKGIYEPGKGIGMRAQQEYEGIKAGILDRVSKAGQITRTEIQADVMKNHKGAPMEYVDSALRSLVKDNRIERTGVDTYKLKR